VGVGTALNRHASSRSGTPDIARARCPQRSSHELNRTARRARRSIPERVPPNTGALHHLPPVTRQPPLRLWSAIAQMWPQTASCCVERDPPLDGLRPEAGTSGAAPGRAGRPRGDLTDAGEARASGGEAGEIAGAFCEDSCSARRSRHQPVGRDPITLAASMTNIRTASRSPSSPCARTAATTSPSPPSEGDSPRQSPYRREEVGARPYGGRRDG
jgi:hypothetical protein